MSRKPLFALLTALCVAALLPASASAAKTNVSVAVADQNASMFDSPVWQALKLKKTRYFVPWNAIDNADAMAKVTAYARAAKHRKVKVLMHISTDNLTPRAAKLPSVKQYRSKVGRLVKVLKRYGVKEWGVWNEANHNTQPTYKSPKRAAQFFVQMRKICKGCTIVALDVLDQRGAESYIKRFYKALGRRRSLAKLVGIHNYSQVNRRLTRYSTRFPGAGAIIKTAKRYNRRAKFWFTETGGVVEFLSFTCNEKRAANRTSFMFKLARKYRRDVSRLYIYNWSGTDCSTRFDAGLVDAQGNPRPAYTVVRKQLKRFRR